MVTSDGCRGEKMTAETYDEISGKIYMFYVMFYISYTYVPICQNSIAKLSLGGIQYMSKLPANLSTIMIKR